MAKDTRLDRVVLRFGVINLSVDDIIEIITSYKFSNVRASSGHFEFENLEDISANKSIFSGEPTIFADKVIISFNRFGGTVTNSWEASKDDVVKATSLFEEIRSRKTYTDKISDYAFNIIILIFLIQTFIVIIPRFMGYNVYENNIISVFSIALVLAMFMLVIWGSYTQLIRRPISYRPSEGFFRRNSDRIIVGSFSAIAAAIATYFFSNI